MSEVLDPVFELDMDDDEILSDFLDSVYEAIEYIEHDLATLERDPNNENAINGLFRSLHSLKGNARMCSITPLDVYGHVIEEVISDIRSARLQFTAMLKEIILLSLDHFRSSAEELIQSGKIKTDKIQEAMNAYVAFHQAPPAEADALAQEIIKVYTGEAVAEVPIECAPVEEVPASAPAVETVDSGDSGDLEYFEQLSTAVDTRIHFWEGRTKSILETCLATNRQLHVPLDESQVKAAVFIHDIGMGFLPDEILNKNQKLNAFEEKRMHNHVDIGYQFLKRIPGWEGAAQMVLQHHERFDGNGYPNKAKGADICIGAQLIAVADTFFSLTNQRADRAYKRSLLRAITEINACKGTQFSVEVVEAFNVMVRKLYTNKS